MPACDPIRDAYLPESSRPTWEKAMVLILGTILARGRRTVTAASRALGLQDDPGFSKDHQVFNRATSSPRRLGHRLLAALVRAFAPGGVGLTCAIDETLERRRARRSTSAATTATRWPPAKERPVAASSIRRIVPAPVVTPPGRASPGPCRPADLPCVTTPGWVCCRSAGC